MQRDVEIKNMITAKARSDERIRAVLLNGSRANSKIIPDNYQDFDILFVVKEIESFMADPDWINIFGERVICQLPEEMTFGEIGEKGKKPDRFTYLMLFKNGGRIDLTLVPINELQVTFKADSLTIVWLDKDNIFSNISQPSDIDYLIKRPTEKEYLDTCNEFWWVSTYVSKGLVRGEITYAKEILETIVRPMFMKIIEWHIGIETSFLVSFGKGGRFMKSHLSIEQYEKILATYSNYQLESNWGSLFIMTGLFSEFATHIANQFNFLYNIMEEENVKAYIEKLYQEQK